MFACRFIFEAYAKKRKREANWMLLKMFCLMLMDMYFLPEFDAYQGPIAPSYFKSHANSWYSYFFQKKVCLMSGLKFTLFDVTSVLPENLSGLKKNYFQTCTEINTLSELQ